MTSIKAQHYTILQIAYDCFEYSKKSYLNQGKVNATFSLTLEYLPGLKILSERNCKLKSGSFIENPSMLASILFKAFLQLCFSLQVSLYLEGGGGGGEHSFIILYFKLLSRPSVKNILL